MREFFTTPNVIVAVLITVFCVNALSWAEESSAIERARESFEQKLGGIDREVGEKQREALVIKAVMALETLKGKFQQAGNFGGLQAVDEELERLSKKKKIEVHDLVDEPKPLRGLQDAFRKSAARIDEEVSEKKVELQQKYFRTLKARQTRLTKAGNLASAKALQTEIEWVEALDFELGPRPPALAVGPGQVPANVDKRRNAFGPFGLGRPLELGFVEFEGHVYRTMGHESLTYAEAQMRARDLGGSLACLETQDEFEFAKSIVNWEDLWIGITKRDGRLVWENGKALTLQASWINGSAKQDHCVLAGRHRGTVNAKSVGLGFSMPGDARRNWLCEWPSRQAAAKAFMEIRDLVGKQKQNGITWRGRTYSACSHKCRSLQAFDHAQSLGAEVVVPENLEELIFVRKLMPDNKFWIGVTDCIAEGKWVNSHFQPVRWTAWAVFPELAVPTKEPNNVGNKEHFAVSWPQKPHDACWVDVSCNGKHGFIMRW